MPMHEVLRRNKDYWTKINNWSTTHLKSIWFKIVFYRKQSKSNNKSIRVWQFLYIICAKIWKYIHFEIAYCLHDCLGYFQGDLNIYFWCKLYCTKNINDSISLSFFFWLVFYRFHFLCLKMFFCVILSINKI